jgi:hypothetical protein
VSAEQIKLTDRIFAWFAKGMIGLSSGLIVAIYFDLKEQVKDLRTDLKEEIKSIHEENSSTRDRVSKIEGSMGK